MTEIFFFLSWTCQECLKLLTINTHKGLFKFNLLPFEIKVAPSIFQQIMDTILAGLDCAQAYLDDILIRSETRHQHLNALLKKDTKWMWTKKCKSAFEKILKNP